MKKIILFLILILVCFSNFQLSAAWEDLNPIYTGRVNSLAKNNTYFFAATAKDGIYRSKDTMHTWKKISTELDNLEVTQLFANNTQVAAVTKSNGLYISYNNADSWEKLEVLGNEIFTVSGDEDFLYVGTKKGLYVSEDNGKTWNLDFDKVVSQIKCIDDDVYVVVFGEKIFHSPKYNRQWKLRSNGITDPYIFDIDGNKDVLVVCGDVDPGNIFTSTDKGLNWIKRSKKLGEEENFIWTMSGVVANDTAIYVYDLSHSFQMSQDFGETWKPVDHFGTKVDFVISLDNVIYHKKNVSPYIEYLDPKTDSNPYRQIALHNNSMQKLLELKSGRIVSINTNQILYSDDYIDWKSAEIFNTRLRDIIETESGLLCLSQDKESNYQWILYSSNNGETWQKQNSSDSLINAAFLYTYDDKFYAYTDNGYYLSEDNGVSWSDWIPFKKQAYLIDVKDNVCYFSEYNGTYQKLYKSYDWGKNYEKIIQLEEEVHSVRFLKSDKGMLNLTNTQNSLNLTYKRDDEGTFKQIAQNIYLSFNTKFAYKDGVFFIINMYDIYYLMDGDSILKKLPKLNNMDYGNLYINDSYLYAYLRNAIYRFPLSELDLTSVEKLDVAENEVIIYPNPSSKIFNIKIDNPSNQTYKYELLDSKGSVLISSESTQEQLELNLSNFAKGSYFIHINLANQTQLHKLILE